MWCWRQYSVLQKIGGGVVDYHAIEGSESIVAGLWSKYTDLKAKIVIADFTENIPFDSQFDLIVDRASLTHNKTKSIKKSLSLIYNHLMPSGKYIGIDWFSTLHSDFINGESTDDRYTRCNYSDGQFANVGQVHFSNEKHLKNLFSNFEIEIMELKTVQRKFPTSGHIFASWNLVARKGDEK